MGSLRDLQPGHWAVVKGIGVTGQFGQRLRDLGLVEQTAVCCLGESPFGDPRAYRIRGATLAIRNRDAACIWV